MANKRAVVSEAACKQACKSSRREMGKAPANLESCFSPRENKSNYAMKFYSYFHCFLIEIIMPNER
jgi:hypothetical protein